MPDPRLIWISVQDRSPESPGCYLGYLGKNSQGEAVHAFIDYDEDGWDDPCNPMVITHWMPLTSPPTEATPDA